MVTVRDVARDCGVSISTVSRALARPDMVSEETRTRVTEAAERLGYEPSRMAMGLRAGRTHALGLLVPNLSNPHFATIAQGVSEVARAAGLATFVADTHDDPAGEVELVRSLATQTDAVILAAPQFPDRGVAAAKRTPVALINCQAKGAYCVAHDVHEAVRRVVGHLVRLGHRRIGYVAGPGYTWSDTQRQAAIAAEVESQPGLELITFAPNEPTPEGGAAAAEAIVGSGVTAAMTFNDVMAVGLEKALRERGVGVPQALSIVSFDDTYLAALVTPAITCVYTDVKELGRRAAAVVINALEADRQRDPHRPRPLPPREVELLPVHLAVRDSTARPPED